MVYYEAPETLSYHVDPVQLAVLKYKGGGPTGNKSGNTKKKSNKKNLNTMSKEDYLSLTTPRTNLNFNSGNSWYSPEPSNFNQEISLFNRSSFTKPHNLEAATSNIANTPEGIGNTMSKMTNTFNHPNKINTDVPANGSDDIGQFHWTRDQQGNWSKVYDVYFNSNSNNPPYNQGQTGQSYGVIPHTEPTNDGSLVAPAYSTGTGNTSNGAPIKNRVSGGAHDWNNGGIFGPNNDNRQYTLPQPKPLAQKNYNGGYFTYYGY